MVRLATAATLALALSTLAPAELVVLPDVDTIALAVAHLGDDEFQVYALEGGNAI